MMPMYLTDPPRAGLGSGYIQADAMVRVRQIARGGKQEADVIPGRSLPWRPDGKDTMISIAFIVIGNQPNRVDSTAQFGRDPESKVSLPSGVGDIVGMKVDRRIELRPLSPIEALSLPTPSGH